MTAAQREIFPDAWAAVLAGDDVVDREAKPSRRLRHAAIFADLLRPETNQIA
jgi:hypothetical protein